MTIVYWLGDLAISIWYLQFVLGNHVLLISSMDSGVCCILLSTALFIGLTIIDFWSHNTPHCLVPNISCFEHLISAEARSLPFTGLSFLTCEMSWGSWSERT